MNYQVLVNYLMDSSLMSDCRMEKMNNAIQENIV